MNEIEIAAGLGATPGYRYADRVGGELFVAGQVPLDRAGELVGAGDPAAQTTACLDNLRVLVEAHGFGVGDVRRLVFYVVGPQEHLREAWAATRSWFDDVVPPATLLGVARLGYSDQLVEVDATVISTG
jgi:enamine deaminase RidA (YjgF/YER057c/UK114 family)